MENYELQYLSPKLTTGSNHNFHFSSSNIRNDNEDNIDKLYYKMKFQKTEKNNKFNSDKKRILKKNHFNNSLDYKYKSFAALENDNSFIKGSSNKLTSRIKKKLNI